MADRENGIKGEVGYFDQFLILYDSIVNNWKGKRFSYKIFLLHSIPFSAEKVAILESLDLNVILVNYPDHPTKIRPCVTATLSNATLDWF